MKQLRSKLERERGILAIPLGIIAIGALFVAPLAMGEVVRPLKIEQVKEVKKPAPQPQLSASLKRTVDSYKRRVKAYRMQGEIEAEKALNVQLEDGKLKIDLSALPNSSSYRRIKVKGMDGDWVFYNRKSGTRRYSNMQHYRFDQAAGDGFWMITISDNSTSQSITGRGGEKSGIYSVSLTQYGGRTRLIVSNMKNGRRVGGSRVLQAESFEALRRQHPKEVREYVRPLLAGISLGSLVRPGAADAYRIFPDIEPDTEVAENLNDSILPKLDDPDFTVREAATDELFELGRPGVLAVIRLDWDELSVEQANRLGLLVAAYSSSSFVDLDNAENNLDLLVDCLVDEDRRVRKAALKRINAITGEALEFDFKLPQRAASMQAEKIRRQIEKHRKGRK